MASRDALQNQILQYSSEIVKVKESEKVLGNEKNILEAHIIDLKNQIIRNERSFESLSILDRDTQGTGGCPHLSEITTIFTAPSCQRIS